jgi:hypothetical protein
MSVLSFEKSGDENSYKVYCADPVVVVSSHFELCHNVSVGSTVHYTSMRSLQN